MNTLSAQSVFATYMLRQKTIEQVRRCGGEFCEAFYVKPQHRAGYAMRTPPGVVV